MPVVFGQTGPIPSTSTTSGNLPALQGPAGELVATELRGKYAFANYKNRLFSATVTGATVPVITTAVASVFSLYNPPGSGVYAEMVETTLANVIATTVVNAYGWYFNTAASTAGGTFTTKGTVQSNVVGGVAGQVQFFTSYTTQAAITPTLIDIIGGHGGITNATAQPIQKLYDGKLILPPGIAMIIAASTAASTGSGMNIQATWAEFPFP